MRQRRVSGIDGRLAVYAELILRAESEDASEYSRGALDFDASRTVAAPAICPCSAEDCVAEVGQDIESSQRTDVPLRWYQRLSPRYGIPEGYDRVYVEFGCGRGSFINAMAAEDPEGLYIGIEGCKTIIISAIEKTCSAGLKNVRYIDAFVNDAALAFEECSLAGVLLNFSDPWPKDRHADRRLTAPAKAESYFRILKPNGFAAVKTDHEALFEYSLETFAGAGFHIAMSTRDLTGSAALSTGFVAEQYRDAKTPGVDMPADLPTDTSADATAAMPIIAARAAATPTEYERRFRSLGQPIFHFIAQRV